MRIIYDNIQQVYGVQMEPSETITIINTDDIVEARKEFVSRMTWMFNQAICKQLKYDSIEYEEAFTNKTCASEEDHEWVCCGMSTAGSNYVCKKCYAHKTVPYTSSSSNYYKGE